MSSLRPPSLNSSFPQTFLFPTAAVSRGTKVYDSSASPVSFLSLACYAKFLLWTSFNGTRGQICRIVKGRMFSSPFTHSRRNCPAHLGGPALIDPAAILLSCSRRGKFPLLTDLGGPLPLVSLCVNAGSFPFCVSGRPAAPFPPPPHVFFPTRLLLFPLATPKEARLRTLLRFFPPPCPPPRLPNPSQPIALSPCRKGRPLSKSLLPRTFHLPLLCLLLAFAMSVL